MTNSLRILALDVTNVKRISAAHIEPRGNVVILGGKNGAGKTSILDAIEMVLSGKDAIPPKPIRNGAKKASASVDLGEVLVTRTFTAEGGGTLKIEAKVDENTRAAIRSPQAWLNDRIGRLSFDPLAFMRQKPAEQGETLRALVGLDTSTLDGKRKVAYDERTAINRQIRDSEGAVAAMPSHPDAPAEPVSPEAIQAELSAAKETNAKSDQAARQAENLIAEVTRAGENLTAAKEEVVRLEGLLATARETVTTREAALASAKKTARDANAKACAMPRIDEAPIIQRLTDAATVNAQVAANKAKAEAIKKLDELRAQSQKHTDTIEAVDVEKAALLSKTPFPVAGLGFDEAGGVTFKDLPLCQASGAEQVRVSMAMALAMNPKLRLVLIRDASLLDTETMAIVAGMAQEADAQVWLERVEEGDEGAVIIEDGTVQEEVSVERAS